MAEANRTAAARAAMGAATSREATSAEAARCCILGCTERLLQCNGRGAAGDASWHYLCVPCLDRWFVAQGELREECSLRKHTRRRTCPVCQVELRAASSDVRGGGDQHAMGLLKVLGTWG